MLLYWCEYNFEDINSQEINESIIKQPLWYNSNIKHENQTLFLKKMYSKGIINIEDVLALNRVDSIFLTLEQIKDKYNVKLNFLEYASILNSIPKKITYYLQNRGSVQNIHNNPAVMTFMYKVEKVTCNGVKICI